MNISTHRYLGAALLCSATLLMTTPVSAATKTADVGYFIAPAGKPSLRFSAQAGQVVTGRVRIENLSDRSRTIRISAADLVTSDTGGASFPAAAPKDVGTWLKLDRELVHLSGHGATIVGFRAQVPSTATPGEHYAGIVAVDAAEAAATKRPSKQRNVVEIRRLARLALPVRLTLPGPLAARLALTEMHFSVDASGSSLRVGMQNAGNQIIRKTDMDLKISQSGRQLLAVQNEIRDFITNSSISYPVVWRGQLTPGSYRVTGVIRPQGGPPVSVDQTVDFTPELAQTLEQKTGKPATPSDGQPIWIWAILAVVVMAAIAITTAYVRLRRRLRIAASRV
jgi:hypothetical protein